MTGVPPKALAAAAGVVIATSSLVAQSLNVDFGSVHGTPAAAFGAAAGQPGAWNTLDLGATPGLLGLAGEATAVGVTVTAGTGTGNVDACTGDELALTGDNFFSTDVTWTVAFDGMDDARYQVYLYGPSNTAVPTGTMTVNGVPVPGVSGDTCELTEGVAYATVVVTVTGGTLTIVGDPTGTSYGHAGLAGLQIQRLPPQRPVRRVLPGRPVPGPESASLIDGALARGEIDADTALKYKVFAAFEDPRLPTQYRGDDRRVVETTILEELNERFDTLSPEDQEILGAFLLRPSSVGSWLDPAVASSAPFHRARALALGGRPACQGVQANWASIVLPVAQVRVWYDTSKPSHNTVAQAVAQDIEGNAWPALITQTGFQAPQNDTSVFGCDGGDDRLDVYIVDQLAGRGLTVPEGLVSSHAATYILLKSTLAPVVREHSVTHELMHAIQWSYPMASSQNSYGWLRDAMANWAVDLVHPGNASLKEMATCYTQSPELPLDNRDTGHCLQDAGLARDYGAYLFFQFLARTHGPAVVKQVLQATTAVGTSLGATDSAIPGGFQTQWPAFAKTLWNQAPIDAKPASFKMWDGQTAKPVLAEDLPNVTSADLHGLPEDKTDLEAKIVNLSSRYYHFTFSDPNTRSLMFHNGFFENWKRGEKVNVQALLKPAGTPWVEEDWTHYEWIGLCRDIKAQRVEELVVIVSSAEWDTPGNYPVFAVGTPSLKRNNIGCWGFEGTATRAFRYDYWSPGGTHTVSFDAHFTAGPAGQYSDPATGRLRVPISAPLFAGGSVTFNENYTSSGCTRQAHYARSEVSNFQGGTSAASLVIRYFDDALPDSIRIPQQALLGGAPRAYTGNGQTNLNVHVLVGSDTCSGVYYPAIGAWLLTNSQAGSSPQVPPDGHLRGTFQDPTPGVSDVYTWDLAPVLEP